jgi:hypothetical protein
MSYSGQSAEAGAIGGAAEGGSQGGPWGALAGLIIGGIGGGFMGGGTNVQYDPKTVQLANLSNLQWQQATNAAYGLQDQLINYAEDPNQVQYARQQAQANAAQQGHAAQATTQRMLASQGIKLTPLQQASLNKEQQLNAGAVQAGAANAAAQQTYATQQQVLAGG